MWVPASFSLWLGLIAILATRTRRALCKAGFVQGQPVPRLDVHHEFDPATAFVRRGGCRAGRFYSSSPLTTLTADRLWVRLSTVGRTIVWIDRDEIDQVQIVDCSRFNDWIRFATADGRLDGVADVTSDPQDVVARLAELGWPTGS